MADNSSPQVLEDLLVDEEQMNRELLANLLDEYVRIGNESGSLITRPAFKELTAKRKIVVVLLAQRASHELGKANSEWLSPSEISEISGIKSGTIYPSIRDLEEEGIAESDDGSYHIPPYNFTVAKQFIKEEI